MKSDEAQASAPLAERAFVTKRPMYTLGHDQAAPCFPCNIVEQGFSQFLHMQSKSHNRLDLMAPHVHLFIYFKDEMIQKYSNLDPSNCISFLTSYKSLICTSANSTKTILFTRRCCKWSLENRMKCAAREIEWEKVQSTGAGSWSCMHAGREDDEGRGWN